MAYVNDLHIVGAVEFSLNVVYFVKSLVVQDSVEKIKEAVPIAAAEPMPVVEPPSTPIDVQVKINNNKVFLLEDAKNEKTRVILAQVRRRLKKGLARARTFVLSLMGRGDSIRTRLNRKPCLACQISPSTRAFTTNERPCLLKYAATTLRVVCFLF